MKFIFVFLSTTLILILAIIILNLYVDPAGLYDASKSIEKEMAEALARGKNILIEQNFDERFFQVSRFEAENKKYPIVITGSSRIMPIRGRTLDAELINLGVSGACLDDHVVLGVKGVENFSPKIVIIGVDPWIFNKNLININKSGLNKWYKFSFEKIGSAHFAEDAYSGAEKNLQLINFSYTKESIQKLLKFKYGNVRFVNTELDVPAMSQIIIRVDGSRQQCMKPELLEQSAIDRAAIEYSKLPVYNLQYFEYSQDKFCVFLRLIDYLSRESKVLLLLPPYHPLAYSRIIENYPDIKKIENNLIAEADARGILLIGSYNPEKIGCQNSDFYDGMHPTEECWRKLLEGWRSNCSDLK